MISAYDPSTRVATVRFRSLIRQIETLRDDACYVHGGRALGSEATQARGTCRDQGPAARSLVRSKSQISDLRRALGHRDGQEPARTRALSGLALRREFVGFATEGAREQQTRRIVLAEAASKRARIV